MTDWFYPYPDLQAGVLVQRYKRFFADITLDTGETITAHCPNTGPMTGVCRPGHRVYVSRSDNPKRKLAYTWELIELNDTVPTLVGTNTARPNQVVKAALAARAIPALGPYDEVKTEVVYGRDRKSRIDFVLLRAGDRPLYVEVKNTTWVQGTTALFPDTVTTRGQKHLQELIELQTSTAADTVMLYFINRGDCDRFAPGDVADPTYGALFRQAQQAGTRMLPCRFTNTLLGITYGGLAELARPD